MRTTIACGVADLVTYAGRMSIPIVPRPGTLTVHDGQFELGPDTPVRAPEPLAALVRELLGPATGYPLAPGGPAGPGGIELVEVDDPALGAEGYRLSVTGAGVRAEGSPAGLRWAVQTLRQLLPAQI